MISRRNLLKGFSAIGVMTHQVSQAMAQGAIPGAAGAGKKGVMLMNRIGPSSSDLYIANADGSGERKLLQNAVFEYNASFAPDGPSVVFTSERNGAGQSDIFRARIDGSGVEPLVTGPAVEDAAALSPDGTRLAFVSTRNGYRANIWVLDLKGSQARIMRVRRDGTGLEAHRRHDPIPASRAIPTAAASAWSPTAAGRTRCRSISRRTSSRPTRRSSAARLCGADRLLRAQRKKEIARARLLYARSVSKGMPISVRSSMRRNPHCHLAATQMTCDRPVT